MTFGTLMNQAMQLELAKRQSSNWHLKKRQAFSAQGGNREWATSIEAIRTTGKVFLPTFVLVKIVSFC